MSNRLNQEREKKLMPIRVRKALGELGDRNIPYGFIPPDQIEFVFKDCKCKYFAYSGWATGKSIKDGRGLKNLLKQLDKE